MILSGQGSSKPAGLINEFVVDNSYNCFYCLGQ